MNSLTEEEQCPFKQTLTRNFEIAMWKIRRIAALRGRVCHDYRAWPLAPPNGRNCARNHTAVRCSAQLKQDLISAARRPDDHMAFGKL
jgi:hypothetical protein